MAWSWEGKNSKAYVTSIKRLKMWVSLVIMGNKQDEKLIAITHSTQIWAMINNGPFKGLH
jgi:hypothetical protein